MAVLVTSSAFTIDTAPDIFTFQDVTNATRGAVTPSPTQITVAGLGVADVPITIVGGEYELDDSGSWLTAPGVVSNGTKVKVRHTSSAAYSTAVNTTITIGARSDIYTSRTIPSASAPVINSPVTVQRGGGFTIQGTNFGDVQGTGYVTLSDGLTTEVQTVTQWTNNEISCTDVSVSLPYGSLTLTVWNSVPEGGSAPINYTVRDGHQYVTISNNPNTGEGSLLDSAFTDAVQAGDQLEIDDDGTTITIDADGNWETFDAGHEINLNRAIYRYATNSWSVSEVSIYEDPVVSGFQHISTSADRIVVSYVTNVLGGDTYWYASASATPPTAADLRSGSGSLAYGSVPCTATTTQQPTLIGLDTQTTYYVHILQGNGTSNSDIMSTGQFTTSGITGSGNSNAVRHFSTGVGTVFVIKPPGEVLGSGASIAQVATTSGSGTVVGIPAPYLTVEIMGVTDTSFTVRVVSTVASGNLSVSVRDTAPYVPGDEDLVEGGGGAGVEFHSTISAALGNMDFYVDALDENKYYYVGVIQRAE